MEFMHQLGQEGEDTDNHILAELAYDCQCEVEDLEGVSISDIIAQISTQADHPKVSEWKEHQDNGTECSLHFDAAKLQMWEAGKAEFKHIFERTSELLSQTNATGPLNLQLFDLFFDVNSEIYGIFHRRLVLQYQEFWRFLVVFFTAALFSGHSTTRIYAQNIKLGLILSQHRYKEIWNQIANQNLVISNGKRSAPPGTEPFWAEIQTALNKTLSKIFVQGYNLDNMMLLTFDDDKVHYAAASAARSDNLKFTKHVRDNRNGYVANTGVLTVSGAPIGIEFEWQDGDTTSLATERLTRQQLRPTNQSARAPNLRNVQVAADRGYWTARFMYDFVLASGADILSTQKRGGSNPFTYSQELGPLDGRTPIPVKGPKSLMVKHYDPRGSAKEIAALAYREGNGKAPVLMMSSEHRGMEWNIEFKSYKEAEQYRTCTLDPDGTCSPFSWFKQIFALDENDDAAKEHMDSLDVTGLTTGQSGQEWFVLRKFSLTSSTTDKCLSALKDFFCRHPGSEVLNSEDNASLRATLKYVFPNVTLPTSSDESENAPGDEGAENGPSPDILKDIIQNNSSAAIQDLRQMIAAKTLSSVTLVVFVEALGGTAGATNKNNEQKLVKWLDSVPADRPYVLLSKVKLIDLCVQRMPQQAGTFYTSKPLNVLKDMLKSNGPARHTSGSSSA
jgi:hypothetical protein